MENKIKEFLYKKQVSEELGFVYISFSEKHQTGNMNCSHIFKDGIKNFRGKKLTSKEKVLIDDTVNYFKTNESFIKLEFIDWYDYKSYLFINKKVTKKLNIRLNLLDRDDQNFISIDLKPNGSKSVFYTFDTCMFNMNEDSEMVKAFIKELEMKDTVFGYPRGYKESLLNCKEKFIDFFGEDVYNKERLIYEVGGYN